MADDLDAFLDGGDAPRGDDVDAFLDIGPEFKPGDFDTVLTPNQEARFQAWKRLHAPDDSGDDYDLRGAFLSGLTADDKDHWPDTFKKPNHPTFSVESKYAVGGYRDRAGRWDGDIFVPAGAPDPTLLDKAKHKAGQFADRVQEFGQAAPEGYDDMKLSLGASEWLATGDSGPLAAQIAERERTRAPPPDYVQRFREEWDRISEQYHQRPDGVRDTLSAIGQGLASLGDVPSVGYTALEQGANMLPAVGGAVAGAGAGSLAGPVGAIAGGAAGMAAGEIALEAGAKVLELLREAGVPLDNPEAVKAALDAPWFREEAAKKGLAKGATIAAVDLATMGIGGRVASTGARMLDRTVADILTKSGVDLGDKAAVEAALQDPRIIEALTPAFESAKGMGKRGAAAAFVGETMGEGFGEGLGEMAAGGDPTMQGVAMEMLGSAGMSAAQAGAAGAYETSKARLADAAKRAREALKTVDDVLAGKAPAPETPSAAPEQPAAPVDLDAIREEQRAEREAAAAEAERAGNYDEAKAIRDELAQPAQAPLEDIYSEAPGTVAAPEPATPLPEQLEAAPAAPEKAPESASAPPAPSAPSAPLVSDEEANDVRAQLSAKLGLKKEVAPPAETPTEDPGYTPQQLKALERAKKQRERYAKESQLDPATDDILTAIAKIGGWSREEAEAQGIDPAEFGRRGWRLKRVFTNAGDTADGLAERLAQYGYPVVDENGNYGANALLDAVSRALSGERIGTGAFTERLLEQAMQEDPDAAAAPVEDDADPFANYEPIYEPEAYDGLETPEEEALFDATRAAIESGMSHDEAVDFVERAAIQGLSNDEIRQALSEAQAERERAQGGVETARSEGERDQADEGEPLLQSYTEEDLRAADEKLRAAEDEKRKAEEKARVDDEIDQFLLTGSDRPADEAGARGQSGLFDAPDKSKKTEERPKRTIKDVPPIFVNRARVKVDQRFEGEGVKKVEMSAAEALKDLNREIAAFKKLLKCVSK